MTQDRSLAHRSERQPRSGDTEAPTQGQGALDWAVSGPPIGVWVTAAGTADALMRDTLCLRADGTGDLRSQSALHGEETLPVLWRHKGPGLLMVAMRFPGEDASEPPEWEVVRYAAATLTTDTATQPVLKNTGDDVFWTLAGPVALLSRTPD
jgi:hypothetical protein